MPLNTNENLYPLYPKPKPTKSYAFYWKSGKLEILMGTSPENAFVNGGYADGRMDKEVEYVGDADKVDYIWVNGKWRKA